MNEFLHHELLSAYLDGEVTPTERAAVEERLESDAEARGELDELDHVASLLRDLPRLNAPANLRDDVLAEIRSTSPRERPTTVERPDSLPAAAAAFHDRSRGRLGAVAALVATVACAFVVTSMLGPEDPTTRVDVSESRTRNFGANSATDSSDFAAVVRDGTSNETVGPVDESPLEWPAIADAELRIRGGDKTMDLALDVDPARRKFARNLASGEGQSRATIDDRLGEALPLTDEPRTFLLKETDLAKQRGYVDPVDPANASPEVLEALAPGDVVPFVDRTGGRVAIVEVTVADVRRAYGEVQLLLKRNAITELEELPAAGESASNTGGGELGQLERLDTHFENAQRKAGADDLFAVYVTTTPRRLAATLAALRESDLVVGLESRAPDALLADRESKVAPDEKDLREQRGTKPSEPLAMTQPRAVPVDAPSPLEGNAGKRPRPTGPVTADEGEGSRPAAKPGDHSRNELAETKKDPAAAAPPDTYRRTRQVENSYQLLRRADPVATRSKLGYGESAPRRDLLSESAHPEALRPAAADAIRARRIDDESVRVLILLRPIPKSSFDE